MPCCADSIHIQPSAGRCGPIRPRAAAAHLRAGHGGFTLVELLVAASVGAILLLAMVGILNTVSGSWSRDSGRVQSVTEARAGFDFLTTDLSSAVLRPDRGEWLQVLPERIGVEGGAVNSVWLMLFTPAQDRERSGAGDLCAVAYRLALQDPLVSGGDQPIFALYRAMVAPLETFREAIGSADLATDFWQPRDDAQPVARIENLVAANVVDFRVRFWLRTAPDEPPQRVGADQLVRVSDRVIAGSDGTEYRSIDSVELSLTVLRTEGVNRLRQAEDGSRDAFDRIVREFGETFEARVPLRGLP